LHGAGSGQIENLIVWRISRLWQC